LRPAEIAAAIISTVVSHLLIFVMLYAALRMIRTVASRFPSKSKIEFYAVYLLVAIGGILIIRRVVLPTIALSNYLADVYAIATSGSVVAFLVGLRMKFYRTRRVEFNSGLEMALLPFTPALPSKPVSITLLLMIGFVGYVAPATLAREDWDFLLQKLSIIGIWAATFVIFYSMQSQVPRKKCTLVIGALVVVVTLGAYKAMGQFETGVAGLLKETNILDTLERYSGNDISFKVAREILSPATDDDAFYSFLRKAAEMSPTIHAASANVSFTDELTATQGAKPNIFIFAVDSFRRDYLSPYNTAVDFTPSIASFARESVVMENAFTHYSGTALAEPSIWIGGMLLHAHGNGQILYEMNSLQKLVEAEGYQSFITTDRILQSMVRPSSSIVQLDKDLGLGGRGDRNDYVMAEFSRTLKELETRLDERTDRSRPVFAYSQPQNLHLLMTYKKDVPAGEVYPAPFYGPYASRVRRVDACFGEFIDYLKAQGMYDNSIIILTSDHGDEHGEGGRWGHAYWLFPNIIRIPLIIHLPSKLRNNFQWNSQAIAFSVDITPSLYYLLGHKPTMQYENFGRPLFTFTQEEQTAYLQESYLLVSSYAPVFGILGNKGRSLYIANAVDNRDWFFDLQHDPAGVHNQVTARLRAENQKLIHDAIMSIQQFYNQGPGAPLQRATNGGSE
jgi:arylsulfatase A-like enzyme